MDNSDDVVTAAPKRPNFSSEFRREIVEKTMQPGASVSRIAREHGLNDNMVFKWRQRFKREQSANATTSVPVSALVEPAQLLPVNVIDVASPPTTQPATIPPVVRWESRSARDGFASKVYRKSSPNDFCRTA